MNRKILVLPAAAVLLTPLLAACGGAEDGRAIVVGTTDQFIATEDAPAPLDPAFAYDTGTWNILRQTVQTLLHVPRGGGEPVPEAAQTCGFSDKASESYRCKLRSGLTFADGTPVTAEDVKYSIERVLKIKSDNGTAALLSNVDTVETKGDAEVVFHLKAPDATFPYKLSTPVAADPQQGQVRRREAPRRLRRRRLGPVHHEGRARGREGRPLRLHQEPEVQGRHRPA